MLERPFGAAPAARPTPAPSASSQMKMTRATPKPSANTPAAIRIRRRRLRRSASTIESGTAMRWVRRLVFSRSRRRAAAEDIELPVCVLVPDATEETRLLGPLPVLLPTRLEEADGMPENEEPPMRERIFCSPVAGVYENSFVHGLSSIMARMSLAFFKTL